MPGETDSRSLVKSAGQNALWNISTGAWHTLVRLLSSMILARVLEPEDFGLFGLALMINEFFDRLGPLSMGSGIIAKKDVTQDDYGTCFTMMVVTRLILFCFLFLISPIIADFFDNQKLSGILKAVSIMFILTAASSVSRMILFRQLDFKSIAIIENIAIVFESIIAISLVLLTSLTYWALIISMLAAGTFINVSLIVAAKWMPVFRYDQKSFRYLFRFGINSLGKNIMEYFTQNIDYLIVVKMMGINILGLYEFAYRIPHLIEAKFIGPASGVLFPTFAKLQNDIVRIIKGSNKTSQYIGILVFPLLSGLAVVAKPFVLVLWGQNWIEIIFPLRVLCFCAIIKCISTPLNSLFLSIDRPDIPFKISIFGFLAAVPFVGSSCFYFGLKGVSFGMLAVTVTVVSLSYFWAVKLTYNFLGDLFKKISTPCVCALCCIITSSFTTFILSEIQVHEIINLVASIAIGGITYVGTFYFFYKKLFKEALALGKSMVS